MGDLGDRRLLEGIELAPESLQGIVLDLAQPARFAVDVAHDELDQIGLAGRLVLVVAGQHREFFQVINGVLL